MGVTLQAGFLASCVVFGPMAMAGWHLTRNRVLFFSGSLFIVLAVSVHVFPYFPVLNFHAQNLSEMQAVVDRAFMNDTLREYCVANLHKVDFTIPEGEVWNHTDWDHWDWAWDPEPLRHCKYQKLHRSEALQLLQGTWIVIAGDSQSRLLFTALLELLLPSISHLRPHLFKRHSDFRHSLENHRILMEFIWAPYTHNLTRLALRYREDQKAPDIFVSGAGLWHMLHNGNQTQFSASLVKLRRALESLMWGANPQLFWMSLPTLLPSLYQSELKIERMTTQKLRMYSSEVAASEITGLATLLDIQALSERCGGRCTQDGVHYSQGIYRAAVHVMINNLLIVTKQTPIT